MLRHAVLAELAREPGIAHQVLKRLEDDIGQWWGLSDGAVRIQLQESAKSGLARVRADPRGRKVFEITAMGREELRRWGSDERPVAPAYRNDLVLRSLYAEGEGRDRLLRDVDEQLFDVTMKARVLGRRLQALTEAPASLENGLAKAATERALGMLDAEDRWLRQVTDIVSRAAKRTRGRSQRDQAS